MAIKSISGKIFGITAQNKVENAGSHTNPFGVSFKGNIIHADVFESAAKNEAQGSKLIQRASEKSRMVMSAIVGSVNSASQAFGARIDSIVRFGRTIRENAARTWNHLNSIKVEDSIGKAWNHLNSINVEDSIGKAWNYLNSNNLRMSFDIVNKGSASERELMLVEGIADIAKARVIG